jgi:hypothetical protein
VRHGIIVPRGGLRLKFEVYCEDEKKAHHRLMMGLKNIPGNVLLSHDLSVIVSSALESLTSVFGMGTGVTPPV